MKMRFRTLIALLVGIYITFSGSATAGIIDHGDFTEVNELYWLDWSLTVNKTQTEALAAHAGYRVATLDEMEGLVNTIFDEIYDFGIHGNIDGDNTKINELNIFRALFGQTGTTGGIYDWSSMATVVGVGAVGVRDFFGDYNVFAAYGRNGQNGSFYLTETNNRDEVGVALVRAAVTVNAPSALAIFALGLVGLASRRLKKQA
jgi:hypothetical protein